MIEPICKVKVLSVNGVISRSGLDEKSAEVHTYSKGKNLFGYAIKESEDGAQYVRVSDINSPQEWIRCWDPDGQNPRVLMDSLELHASSQMEKLFLLLATMNNNSSNPTQSKDSPIFNPGEKLFDDLDEIKGKIGDLSTKVEKISDLQASDHKLISEHDRILVRGSETRPSLQEVVRVMAERQNQFFQDIKDEKESSKKANDEELKRKKDEWSKWKWVWVGLALTLLPKFLWEAITFWITVVVPSLKTP